MSSQYFTPSNSINSKNIFLFAQTKLIKPRSVLPGYELASQEKALQHWSKMSYSKIIKNENGQTQFKRYGIWDDLKELKQNGLGVYLFLQLLKRLTITFFIICILMAYPLYVDYTSTGLDSYAKSYSIVLARFTIGNLKMADRKTYLIHSICDVIGMVIFFFFYLIWRNYQRKAVLKQREDEKLIDPKIYVLSVVGFDKKTTNLEESLKRYFEQNFGGVFQVEIVYDFQGNFDKFVSYQELIKQVQKKKQISKQTGQVDQSLEKLQAKLNQKQQKLGTFAKTLEPIYAIIHFQDLKGKYKFINSCRKYSQMNRFLSRLEKLCCTVPEVPQRLKFNGNDILLIEELDFPRPEAINWENQDISRVSRFLRFIISLLLIAISIFITSSLIAMCTLFVASNSNCQSFDSATTFGQAEISKQSNSRITVFCYCSYHFFQLWDSNTNELCSSINSEVFLSNLIQIAASVVSVLTNLILIFVVTLIPQKILKPTTKSKQYNFIFLSVFLSNLINSIILPLVLNGNIFGFKSIDYLTFLTKNWDLNVFEDFTPGWFAIVSPYFTNFFLLSAISPLIELCVYAIKRKYVMWKVHKKTGKRPTIQREVNDIICKFPFDLSVEVALLALSIFMSYMYATLIPLALPIFAFGLFLTLVCKRYIILNYTTQIPADQSLNEKIIDMLPFCILIHGLFGIWAKTSDGVFSEDAFIYVFGFNVTQEMNQFGRRALLDFILMVATGLVALWILVDNLFLGTFRFFNEKCKDELEEPPQLHKIGQLKYVDRIKNKNIVGSYKLENHPVSKHPYTAYKDLKSRIEQDNIRNTKDGGDSMTQFRKNQTNEAL